MLVDSFVNRIPRIVWKMLLMLLAFFVLFQVDARYLQPAAKERTVGLQLELEAIPLPKGAVAKNTEVVYKSSHGRAERYYDYRGEIPVVTKFYTEQLQMRGWEKLGTSRAGLTWRDDLFCRNHETATLRVSAYGESNTSSTYSLMMGWGDGYRCDP